MLIMGSVCLHLSIARLAYLLTAGSTKRSAASYWWAAVCLGVLCFLIEWYTRGFPDAGVPWQRTANFAFGSILLMFIESWWMGPEFFTRLFAEDDAPQAQQQAQHAAGVGGGAGGAGAARGKRGRRRQQ